MKISETKEEKITSERASERASTMAEKAPIIRFGIMGCATIAIKVSRAISLAPNSTVVAVASRSIDKARNFITAHGLPEGTRAYGSYEEILEDEGVDAMYVPLPTSLHLRWAVATAEKGKHLLLDKPVALCVADLDRILEACEANGVQYMDATMWMHHPRTVAMKELLSDQGRFGTLRSVSVAYFSFFFFFLLIDLFIYLLIKKNSHSATDSRPLTDTN